jgi:hypothetical protein
MQLAVEYAYRYDQEYQTILWVRVHADTHENLVLGYRAIAQELKLPEKDEQDQMIIIQAVKCWLKDTPMAWLLILDNLHSVCGGISESTQRKSRAWAIILASGLGGDANRKIPVGTLFQYYPSPMHPYRRERHFLLIWQRATIADCIHHWQATDPQLP